MYYFADLHCFAVRAQRMLSAYYFPEAKRQARPRYTFSTRSFLIRYCEEEVELGDVGQFRLELSPSELRSCTKRRNGGSCCASAASASAVPGWSGEILFSSRCACRNFLVRAGRRRSAACQVELMFADLTQHPSEPLGDQPDVEPGSKGVFGQPAGVSRDV